MFSKNDVITVVCLAGEITGKFIEGDDDRIKLQDPRMLTQTEQGIGYAKGVCMSGTTDTKEVTVSNYLFAVETNDEFKRAYHQTVSGLVL